MNHSINSEEPAFFHDQMIGKLALNYKLISNDDYIEAVNLQKSELESGMSSPLMEVLIQHDFLTREEIDLLKQVKDMITEMRKEKRFGVIAVKNGFVSEEDLNLALKTQKIEKKAIGRILMDSGLLTEEQCNRILEIQNSIVVKLPSLSDIQKASDAGRSEEITLSDSRTTCGLNVSEDELTAVIILPEGEEIQKEDIYALLRKNGISFGIISDKEIRDYLSLRHLGLNSFIVARGKESVAGVPGELRLKFTPRKLRAGEIDEEGKIDFRNRGDIPCVKKGDLLAELSRMRQSEPGITVYGRETDIDILEDLFAAISGTGVCLDDAEDKIYAGSDGEPCVMTDGTLCVLREVRIDDVDYSSGNIAFEGNIIIAGKVNDGFEVEGVHVTAGEIVGARVVAEGDITVSGGIMGSEISAGGTVRAAYIQDSTISSIGEVLAAREIIDSVVETSGTCSVTGNIISSKITAGKGVQADNIGSRTSKPNYLQVGSFTSAIHVISQNEEIYQSVQTALDELLDQRASTTDKIKTIRKAIGEIENDKSKYEKELQNLKSTIEQIEKKSGKTVKTGPQQIEEFRRKITAAGETIHALKNDRRHYEESLVQTGNEIRIRQEEKSRVNSKIVRLTEWMIENDARPVVRALSGIFADTRIESPNAAISLKDDYFNVTIREVKRFILSEESSGAHSPEYQFQITQSRR